MTNSQFLISKQYPMTKFQIKINAENQVLGRLATKVAAVLRGKDKPSFRPHIAPDHKVVVFNTDKVKITGKKLDQKKYYHYSGYPGGLKEKKMRDVFNRDSGEVLRKAVWGMLPKNRLRKVFMRNLITKKGEKNNG